MWAMRGGCGMWAMPRGGCWMWAMRGGLCECGWALEFGRDEVCGSKTPVKSARMAGQQQLDKETLTRKGQRNTNKKDKETLTINGQINNNTE